MASNSAYSSSSSIANEFQLEVVSATNEKKVTSFIHDDIAFSILSKLPIKSLKRFECVRKSWSHLTEDKDSPFMTMYRNNLLLSQPYDGDTSLLVNMSPRLKKFHSLSGEMFANRVSFINPIQSDYKASKIIGFGSVNGILCLQHGGRSISLWNPTTDEFKVIPPVGTCLPPIVHKFNPVNPFYILTTIHGFGYDSVADDYKLISLESFERYSFYDDRKGSLLLQHKSIQPFWMIYSLTSNSWKKLHVNMPRSSPTFPLEYDNGNHRLYMDGVCHWLSIPTSGACMVSFDLNNETFFVTPIPSYILRVRRRAWTQLVVVNHSIALVSLPYHNTQTYHISIWGEVGVKESWIKLLTVKNPCTLVEFPIGLGMNGEIVFANEDNKLLLFDLNTKKIVELGLNRKYNTGFRQVNFYKKSLLPIKRIN